MIELFTFVSVAVAAWWLVVLPTLCLRVISCSTQNI